MWKKMWFAQYKQEIKGNLLVISYSLWRFIKLIAKICLFLAKKVAKSPQFLAYNELFSGWTVNTSTDGNGCLAMSK